MIRFEAISKYAVIGLCSACFMTFANTAEVMNKVECFPVSNVHLTESRFKNAQDLDVCYLLALNPDRLVAPYRKGAGLSPKAENYTNWENTGLDGHIGGHYLSALSYMYASTGNEEIGKRLDYMLSELKQCQDKSPDGYLCGVPDGRRIWNEIALGDIRASAFDLNGGWVPLYNIHKIFAGLRDACIIGGREEAKPMLIKLADWMAQTVSTLSDEQIQEMLRSEHGGLNEIFADVAVISGDEKYLELAHKFSHRKVLDPIIAGKDALTGIHANTQIPKVIGLKRIADIEGNKSYKNAADWFWRNIVEKRSVSFGGNSVEEHFHSTDDFSKMLDSEQGPETCNTYNMLRLTKMLYESMPSPEFIEYYETALYNHILTSIHPVQGGFVYFTPVRSGHYRVYSQPQTSFWCCVGSGLENHARYGEMIYAHDNTDVYVNLFIPSKLTSDFLSLTQTNKFPETEETVIIVDSVGNDTSRLNLRKPEWLIGNPMVYINNNVADYTISNGYVRLSRPLVAGDTVRYLLPMEVRAVQLPDNSNNYSFKYGPVVLGSKIGSNDMTGHYADDSRGGHIANGPMIPLSKMPVIVDEDYSFLNHIKRSDDQGIHFMLTGISPDVYEGMELIPFYELADCRYMLYWPVLSPDELERMKTDLEQKEKERLAIESHTVDKVACGEQQPESDHSIKAMASEIGNDNDLHWRESQSYFSYMLSNTAGNARYIRLHYKPESWKSAGVYIDDVLVGTLSKMSDTREHWQLFELPEELAKGLTKVTVRPFESYITPHIYEIRLLTEQQ